MVSTFFVMIISLIETLSWVKVILLGLVISTYTDLLSLHNLKPHSMVNDVLDPKAWSIYTEAEIVDLSLSYSWL